MTDTHENKLSSVFSGSRCILCTRSTVFGLDRKMASTDEVIRLENLHLVADVSATSGVLQEMSLRDSGTVVKTDLHFVRYGTRAGKERSGAYLFLPDGEAKVGLLISCASAIIMVKRKR